MNCAPISGEDDGRKDKSQRDIYGYAHCESPEGGHTEFGQFFEPGGQADAEKGKNKGPGS